MKAPAALASSDAPTEARANSVAEDAEAEATRLMEDIRVLEAEAVLAKAVRALSDMGPGAAPAAAAARLRAAPVYAAVLGHVGRYDSFARALEPGGFKLAWEGEGSRLWVHSPPGATWFEYKLVCDIGAPLSHSLAYSNELDLIPNYEPMLVGEPSFLGRTHPLLVVTRSLIGVLALRIEIIFEVLRFVNQDYGFLAESITSRFPEEGRPIPRKPWGTLRIGLDVQNLWVPRGGGERGTIGIQLTHVNVGIRVSESLLGRFIRLVAASMVTNLQQNAERVGQPDSPYEERLKLDKLGLYAECEKAEAAAARRPAISTTQLPGADILGRPWRLPPAAE